MSHLIINGGVAAATMLLATPVAAREHCPDPQSQTEAIVAVETNIFSALENEDRVSWERLTNRDFVAFEGGHRYGRTDLFELVRSSLPDQYTIAQGAASIEVDALRCNER